MTQMLIATPTYNEAGNIEALLRQIHALSLPADILVIDDGSTDGTGEIVQRLQSEMPRLKLFQRGGKMGVGSAHIAALLRAKNDGYHHLVTLDADFSHQPADIPRLLALSDRYQVVLGTRFANAESLSEWSLLRKAITHLGHFLTKALLRIPYDASGGLRVYDLTKIPLSLIESIEGRDYEFFFQSITLFDLYGLKIGEVPVNLPARAYGNSKMRVSHALKGLYKLLSLSVRLGEKRRAVRAVLAKEVRDNG